MRKYILTKDERKNHPINGLILNFVRSVSRGRDTYGFNIVTLRAGFNKTKIASTCGGGYDMEGTVFAEFIKINFKDELKRLNSIDFYGLSFFNRKTKECHLTYHKGDEISLNGGCGLNSMEYILNKIGFQLRFIRKSKKESIYILEAI